MNSNISESEGDACANKVYGDESSIDIEHRFAISDIKNEALFGAFAMTLEGGAVATRELGNEGNSSKLGMDKVFQSGDDEELNFAPLTEGKAHKSKRKRMREWNNFDAAAGTSRGLYVKDEVADSVPLEMPLTARNQIEDDNISVETAKSFEESPENIDELLTEAKMLLEGKELVGKRRRHAVIKREDNADDDSDTNDDHSSTHSVHSDDNSDDDKAPSDNSDDEEEDASRVSSGSSSVSSDSEPISRHTRGKAKSRAGGTPNLTRWRWLDLVREKHATDYPVNLTVRVEDPTQQTLVDYTVLLLKRCLAGSHCELRCDLETQENILEEAVHLLANSVVQLDLRPEVVLGIIREVEIGHPLTFLLLDQIMDFRAAQSQTRQYWPSAEGSSGDPHPATSQRFSTLELLRVFEVQCDGNAEIFLDELLLDALSMDLLQVSNMGTKQDVLELASFTSPLLEDHEDLQWRYISLVCEHCEHKLQCGRFLSAYITHHLEIAEDKDDLEYALELVMDVVTADFFLDLQGTCGDFTNMFQKHKQLHPLLLKEVQRTFDKDDQGELYLRSMADEVDAHGNLKGLIISDDGFGGEADGEYDGNHDSECDSDGHRNAAGVDDDLDEDSDKAEDDGVANAESDEGSDGEPSAEESSDESNPRHLIKDDLSLNELLGL